MNSHKKKLLNFLAAAPAVLAIFVIAVIAISINRSSPAAPQWYQIAADDAFDNRNYRTAAVCYERLLQAHPTDRAMALNLCAKSRCDRPARFGRKSANAVSIDHK